MVSPQIWSYTIVGGNHACLYKGTKASMLNAALRNQPGWKSVRCSIGWL